MKTLGLEMIDAGFEAASGVANGEGGHVRMERLSPPGTVPAVALWDGTSLHFGSAAEARRFLHPRQLSETFWEDLSLSASNIRQSTRPATYSELAYHFVRNFVEELPFAPAEAGSVVLAVPASMTDGSERAEERIGILLGICSDLGLRLSSIVDAACASLLDPEAPPPARGTALVVDLGLHAATLSVVDLGATVSLQAFSRIAGAGWLAMVEASRRALADRFLRQTSFDVSADRHIEQAFHVETLDALDAFTTQPEAWLRVVSGNRERAISVPRDGMVADMRPFSEAIARGAREMSARMGTSLSGVQVYLTGRARHVCGLAKALRADGATAVGILGPGAAARGAAAYASRVRVPDALEDVPVETGLAPPERAQDPVAAIQAALTLRRHAGRRDDGPTHVVVDGYVHPLRNGGVRIAAGGDGGDGGIRLPTSPTGLGVCTLLVEAVNDGWRIAAEVKGERFALPGADAALAPGDVLEVHGQPGPSRVLFARLVR
jgi:hypothetical protein